MCAHMVTEVLCGGEAAGASVHNAGVRPLARVGLHVHAQPLGCVETALAELTLEPPVIPATTTTNVVDSFLCS
jgi:hypothetical protein